jgi:hypothetical protein
MVVIEAPGRRSEKEGRRKPGRRSEKEGRKPGRRSEKEGRKRELCYGDEDYGLMEYDLEGQVATSTIVVGRPRCGIECDTHTIGERDVNGSRYAVGIW